MSINGILFALLTAGNCIAEVVSPAGRLSTHITDLSTTRVQAPHDGYRLVSSSGINNGFDLLDIVLVASVDGRLHALNRTHGDSIWSMAASAGPAPATLGPLVRTQHPEFDPDLTDDDSAYREVYVVEPQSGDIYVMATPDSPLQRLPFSMPQLVDMSPFSFSADDDGRVFVGRKETSLLLIELETGRVKATLNSECPWDPFQDLAEPAEFDNLDLDELEGMEPSKSQTKPTEVFIGRTDYHVSIHTRPSRSSATRPPVQNLSFSVYGPNNQDLGLQSIHRHTADNAYIQSLPNGEIIAFQSSNVDTPNSGIAPDTHLLWGHVFPTPIVAVFDVLKSPTREHPFVLLQPRLRLEDILPNADLRKAAAHKSLPNLDAAFVGYIEESGSLFAMSPDTFPLVVFGDVGVGRFLDPAPDHVDVHMEHDLPGDLDSISRRAKERRLRRMCREGSTDRRCLTGVRKLESSTQSRLSRLLDGAPTVPLPPDPAEGDVMKPNSSETSRDARNASVSAHLAWDDDMRSPSNGIFHMDTSHALSAFALCALALLVAIMWIGMKKGAGKPVAHDAGSHSTDSKPVKENSQTHTPSDAIMADSNAPSGKSNDETAEKPAPDSPRPHTSAPSLQNVVVVSDGLKSDNSDLTAVEPQEETGEGEDSEKEDDAPATAGKRKTMRRKRGKKKKGGATNGSAAEDVDGEKAESPAGQGENGTANEDGYFPPQADTLALKIVSLSPTVVPPSLAPTSAAPSLVVSDTVLGFGSHGTVVFKGSLQGRAVAVKRLLQDFVTLASREVNILQESDDHPNVIRYYYQESHANFLYIALELCPASLADIIERPGDFPEIIAAFEPKRALRQVTAGLRHLHALKIIHRDIKPQNILISNAKKGAGQTVGHRMLISDFGLCKKLELDQTSFLPTAHGAMAAGTVGWRAPEILRGEVKLDDSGDESQSSRGSIGTAGPGTPAGKPTRLTKSVDIFALGCLYYYVLTNGEHPFGDRFEREVNILKNAKNLDGLERFGEEGSEGADLIKCMLSPDACDRPDTSTCLLHPYFWDPGKRLTFLQDASDRFEIMCRDPPDPNLVLLETSAFDVVGNDWHARLDRLFIENLGKFRRYDGKSVQDLLRALRNKKHHYQDLPDNVKRLLGSMPEGFLAYFTRRFPRLFLHVHSVVSASPLRHESMFRSYFDLSD
ncbi:uncharacterized protein LAESUDRAFT_757871 [Laetiporus sulphureus 93-53]|uniref:non-specific serine/threonine protein kinase n=1 Tax=Laetiporus sulphureus 93-53 TaxID=1314785 RepID=A0A165F1R3_9APHY|nr:uncharacterized protein LAESUDRAFT_757871 [Laetiporus sulphureus 93-53]KZT08189.1 hypothetical protein LAESUDRAFT_757871 [Laetiporus sulphureus 93-53]